MLPKTYFDLLSFAVGVLGLLITVYGLATADKSLHLVDKFTKTSSVGPFIPNCLRLVAKLNLHVFGRELISWKGIGSSLIISLISFLVSFALAALSGDGPFLIKEYASKSAERSLDVGGFTPTLVLVVLLLVSEIIYVTKSRWILRILLTNIRVKYIVPLFLLDFISTIIIYAFLCSVVILFMAYLLANLPLEHIGHPINDYLVFDLGEKDSPLKEVHYLTAEPAHSLLRLVSKTLVAIWRIPTYDFHAYHLFFISLPASNPPQVYIDKYMSWSIYVDPLYAYYTSFYLPITTLLCSALFTSFSVSLCTILVLIMISARYIDLKFNSLLLFVHTKPEYVLRSIQWAILAFFVYGIFLHFTV